MYACYDHEEELFFENQGKVHNCYSGMPENISSCLVATTYTWAVGGGVSSFILIVCVGIHPICITAAIFMT